MERRSGEETKTARANFTAMKSPQPVDFVIDDEVDEEDGAVPESQQTADVDQDELEFYIDEELVDDNNNNTTPNPADEFDEKDELLETPLSDANSTSRKKSTDVQDGRPRVASDLTGVQSEYPLKSSPSQSIAYVEDDQAAANSPSFELLDKIDFDERIVMQLDNVTCLFDINQGSQLNRETGNTQTSACMVGRLVLTTYRLQFVPYRTNEKIDPNKFLTMDRNLLLFSNKSSRFAIFIPLTFIFEIKACKLIKIFSF